MLVEVELEPKQSLSHSKGLAYSKPLDIKASSLDSSCVVVKALVLNEVSQEPDF